ncbi:hypothetical protein CZ787_08320 [Halomonas citrativorans]|uniref:Uncharacterized protein n=1 Tax=Halomonas citrativorans TaxID=2742612 RepID=A0A1R4HYJ0_9GAMM|nr:hypothetical protein CZ787_08320 [Halomonas citrativorans]
MSRSARPWLGTFLWAASMLVAPEANQSGSVHSRRGSAFE